MQGAGGILDIIILALFIWFIYSRFMSNDLPKDDGENNKNSENNKKIPTGIKSLLDKEMDKVKVLNFKESNKGFENSNLSPLQQLANLDNSFNEKDFIKGAKEAFNYFYEAKNNRDEDLLDNLTSPKVFDEVIEQLEDNLDNGKIVKTDVKEILSAEIVESRISGRTAIINVKYSAKLAEYEEDAKSGEITKNATKKGKTVNEIWTWARPINSDDPNWELEEISAVS